MTFLHRKRSFVGPLKGSDLSKPLPLLPTFAAVENVPRRRNLSTPTKTLMHRVSLIFRPSPRKKGRPPNLTLATTGSAVNSSRSSLSSVAESEDDIRPPSGLGRPVSIASLPPSPFTPVFDENSPFQRENPGSGEYQRTRAISSPNLLRSISTKVKAKTHLRRASVAPGPAVLLGSHPFAKATRIVRVSWNVPPEVIAIIISYLPRHVVPTFGPVSRSFAAAVRLALYTTLDLQSFRPLQLEKLVATLASRSELTELVHHFICRTWPSFFSFSSSSPHASVDDHRNSLLTATFTLALQRMSNLISLTLPSFTLSLLEHHTAFGLKSLTFLNSTMSPQETAALFAWLNGQTNIYVLKFPNLEDSPTTPACDSSPEKQPPVPPRKPVRSRPNSTFLSLSTPFLSLNPSLTTPTPHSAYFPPLPTSAFSSQTLLPNLTTLHATPFLVHLLSPTPSLCPCRPLRTVSLTINTTLYTGLRPAALMAALQSQGVRHLTLRFKCDSVDRRTVEKVLGAVGAVLGSPQVKCGEEDDGEETEVGDGEGVHAWRGLRSLEVDFQGESTDFSPEEALYKTLQATLPRYNALRNLRLRFSSCDEDTLHFNPLPYAPPSLSLSLSQTSDIAFPTHSPELLIVKNKAEVKPSRWEQARINMWAKQCPSLRSVLLFSHATWRRALEPEEVDDEELDEGVSQDGIPWSAVGLAQ